MDFETFFLLLSLKRVGSEPDGKIDIVWGYPPISMQHQSKKNHRLQQHAYAYVYASVFLFSFLFFSLSVVPIFLTIPNFFAMTIDQTERENTTAYIVKITEDEFLYGATVVLYSVILKLVPCIVLTIITGTYVRR